jgi:hypothetical protein
MGLDQYAFSVEKHHVTAEVDFSTDFPKDDVDEIAYWRKHPNLQGWMQRLYRKKGGESANFNCVPVVLEASDLDALEHDVLNDLLPETIGFFFGMSSPEDKEDDLKFIEKARAAIQSGRVVYYSSWW